MKKIFSGVLLSFLLILTVGANVQAKEGYGKQVEVDVMSYNIHHGEGVDGELDLTRISEVIRDSGAEVIGLQEVDKHWSERSNWENQVKVLADMLGYHYEYAANLNLDPLEGHTENRQYGTAVLSKYPIIDSENIFLSSFGNEQRGLLHTVINVRGIHLDVYNTHLGLSAPERIVQAREIVEETANAEGPAIVLGDLNAELYSEEIQLLLNEGGFVDTFQGAEDANTYPAEQPEKRIDYIFTSPSIESSNQQVIQTEASDHLPLMAEVTLTRR